MGSILLFSDTNGFVIDGSTGVSLAYNGVTQATFGSSMLTLLGNNPYTITHSSTVGGDLTISQTGVNNSSLILSSETTAGNAIVLSTPNGGITIDGATGISMKYNGVTQATFGVSSLTLLENNPYSITHSGDNLTISQTGSSYSSLILSSDGISQGAISINSSFGGVSIYGSTTDYGGITLNNHTTLFGVSLTTTTTSQTELWSLTPELRKACYHINTIMAANYSSFNYYASYEVTSLFIHDGTSAKQLGSSSKTTFGDTGNICDTVDILLEASGGKPKLFVTPKTTDAIGWQGSVTITKSQ